MVVCSSKARTEDHCIVTKAFYSNSVIEQTYYPYKPMHRDPR